MSPLEAEVSIFDNADAKSRAVTDSVTEEQDQQDVALAAGTPAQDAAFDTAELMENVLVYLDVCDIVKAQRICKFFRNVIASSVAIQEKLLVRLRHKGQIWRVQEHGFPGPHLVGPHLLTLVSEEYDLPKGIRGYTEDDENRWMPNAVNALLVQPNRPEHILGILLTSAEVHAGPKLLKGLQQILAGVDAPLLEKMHFTDGPTPGVTVDIEWAFRERSEYNCRTWITAPYRREGWTIGHILQAVTRNPFATAFFCTHIFTSSRDGVEVSKDVRYGLFGDLKREILRRSGPEAHVQAKEVSFGLSRIMLPWEELRDGLVLQIIDDE
ncbi:hypothetical protein CKM354_000190400 [Cercospora kikuchii]|uniref:F-box domain-containing protein n=1 Tax=Cercospora kikuchii TaxID=84275 RepID=A0A9P3C874_9PEZI|nr:uncharacterized protein CKM354_000190400 [Cercospora kikuchii]GIZ38487.1 hypothetical protein CKM354_000190400 [Cercospora kikuchii]